ncbi:MAG: hypothetical protein HUU43_02485 [Ignavibacteriaceae bacterium]|nr:hypothetical protein [Ignavibacteriaceae bacterium]
MEKIVIIIGVILGISIMVLFIKQLQFFLAANKTFEKILARQDIMINLLLDIRDKSRRYSDKDISKILSGGDVASQNESESLKYICDNCEKEVSKDAVKCPHCGEKL